MNISEESEGSQYTVKKTSAPVHKFTLPWALTLVPLSRPPVLRKRIKIEVEDEEGTRYTLALEGKVSRDKLLKAVDMLELMDIPIDHTYRPPNQETFLGKVMLLLETDFAAGDFSSSDVARGFEEKYNQPVKLSTISTYLTRLAEKEYIKRERFGNSWVYRRVYLKTNQLAER